MIACGFAATTIKTLKGCATSERLNSAVEAYQKAVTLKQAATNDKDPNATLAQAIDDFLGNQIGEQTRRTLTARLNDPQILQASLDDPVKQVNEGLIAGLVLGAPEFQRR